MICPKGFPAPLISIHAPRTGSDIRAVCAHAGVKISIHAPRTGSDRCRGACTPYRANFNPRSPHGERQYRTDLRSLHLDISIHAPRTGSDHTAECFAVMAVFQSTLPARGATNPPDEGPVARAISIHAPRTGSDARHTRNAYQQDNFNPRSPHGERRVRGCTTSPKIYFNPRSPHGERRAGNHQKQAEKAFQSTLPARGATCGSTVTVEAVLISIHAPRTGSDRSASLSATSTCAFQSTLPARGATPSFISPCVVKGFQSTLPARGAT